MSDPVTAAVIARILVGAGDAATFISAIRLVPSWFEVHKVPLFTQLTGALGQSGQILSALPLVYLLEHSGWRTAFLTCAGIGVLVAFATFAITRDGPFGPVRRHDDFAGRFLGQVTAALAEPGTRHTVSAPRTDWR